MHSLLHLPRFVFCPQLKDPINLNPDEPVKEMVGCTEWCKESMKTMELKYPPLQPPDLGMECKMDAFSTTPEVYTRFLRDRAQGVQSNQQIIETLRLTAASRPMKVCNDNLYCATVSTPMIESLIAEQQYTFATGPIDDLCVVARRAPGLGLELG